MASKRKDRRPQDSMVRCFEVTDPTLHSKGHTIYKVTQKVIYVDAPEKEVQEFVVWRRYNDFKKLHKAMHSLHMALQRKEEFPPFVGAKVFGRFDSGVLTQRMQSGQDLLNFIGQRHYLVANKAFQVFFQAAIKVESDAAKDSILQPVRELNNGNSETEKPTPAISVDRAPDHLSVPLTDSKSRSTSSEDLLGGVWQFRQMEDGISIGDEDDDDESDTDFTDTDSAVTTPLPKGDIAFFDPLKPSEEQQSSSNEWLLSKMAVLETEVVSEASESTSEEYLKCTASEGSVEVEMTGAQPQDILQDLLLDSQEVDTPDAVARQGSVMESGRGDLTASPLQPSGQMTPQKLMSLNLKDNGDYIIMAANQISLAQQCEANGSFQLAFSYYKSGVGILLTGVQKDDNSTRREVVRRKTARYLMKAEELYHSHLSENQSKEEPQRWDTGQPSPAKDLDPSVALLQAPISELKNYKTIGVTGSVLLVMDALTEGTFVIKVLLKNCVKQDMRRSILPTFVPYVTRLYRYFESDSAIYLLLQYATGGKLWTYVSDYLNQHHEIQIDDALIEDKAKRERSKTLDPAQREKSLEGQTVLPMEGTEVKEPEVVGPEVKEPEVKKPEVVGPEVKETEVGEDKELFQEALERTGRPGLEYFSINSVDSDSEPGSRFHSTASDHVAEINEIPEETDQHVFVDNSSQDLDIDLIAQQAIARSKHSTPAQEVYVVENEDLPSPRRTSKVLLGDDSIYDRFGGAASPEQSSSSDSAVGSPASQNTKQKTSTPKEHEEHLPRSRVCSVSQVYRLPSQDRSFGEPERKPRSRNLSSVFCDLDLAASSDGDEGCHRGPLVRLPEGCVRQWAAEMVVALSRLHSLGIVCRDLKPANILLGERGHILLSHFSWWNCVDWTLDQQAVDDLYVAPEVLSVYDVGPSCDWWSLGALLFELLTSKTLSSCQPCGVTSHTLLAIPSDLSSEAQSLLHELLRPSPQERLGAGPGGVEDIKAHPFFSGISWGTMLGV